MRKLRCLVGLSLLAGCASAAGCSSDPASDPAAPDLATQLEKDTGTPWKVYTDPRSHEIRFLAPSAPVQVGTGTPEEKARAFFTRYRDALHATGKSDEIRLTTTATDARGGAHIRFAHFLPGTDLPVFDSGSTAHFTEDGSLYWLQTDFRADLAGIDGIATVTKEGATAAAVARVNASCGASAGPPVATGATLGILSDPDTHAALAYRVSVDVQSESCAAPSVFVDAKSGIALKIEEGAHSVQDPTVGGSLFFRLKDLRDVKPISVTGVPGAAGRFQMISDDTPSTRVITRSFATGAVIQTNDIAHWDESSSAKGAAADAHFHARKALQFLRPFASQFAAHDRTFVFPLSLDLNVSVHDNSPANGDGFNAFARFDDVTKTDIVHFGDGNFPKVPNALPFSAAYDVVAHELTHLITAHTSNLKYERESGALNESFSDVMGAAAEHALFPDDRKNFLIGENLFLPQDTGTPALRSMTAPRSTGNPDHTDDEIPCPPSGPTGGNSGNDFCGVHSNSGIPNRAFSLLVAGGSLTKFVAGVAAGPRPIGVSAGIGWEKATEVTYWATTGLNATATFENAALAQVAEAKRLDPLAQVAVACAWTAVGVLQSHSDGFDAFLGSTLCQPAVAPPPPPPGPMPVDFCAGRGDALICDPANTASAIQCKGGALAVPNQTEFCADPSLRCKTVSADDLTAVTDASGVIVCE